MTINKDDVHYADALDLDLDRALAHGAAVQKALGSELSLNARRAAALGDLARTQTALDLHPHGHGHTGAKDSDGLPAAREIVLHAHFAASTHGETTVFGPTGRLEEGQRLVLLDQVKDWCGDTRTKITIKPVIDLTTEKSAPGYAIPDRIRDHVVLRDGTCVFPWCSRPARGCDIDHVIPYDHQADAEGRPQPGPTTTENLAALCRFHHRLKTHCESGPAPTTTTTDETGPAPPHSTHPSDHDPAPHPATHVLAGRQAWLRTRSAPSIGQRDGAGTEPAVPRPALPDVLGHALPDRVGGGLPHLRHPGAVTWKSYRFALGITLCRVGHRDHEGGGPGRGTDGRRDQANQWIAGGD